MNRPIQWIMLVYKLPKTKTSALKVGLWRKLKKLGVFQIQDSVCVLPLSEKNTEHFTWISAEIRDAGGDASTWSISAMDDEKDKQIREFFMDQINVQYRSLMADIETVSSRDELLKKWAYFNMLKSQDHLKSPLSVEVKSAFEKRTGELNLTKDNGREKP